MTFTKAAWAIDGALMNSALARTETFAAMSGEQGVIQPGDLRVSALPTPGAGIQIGTGGAVVTNRYQSAPSQSYVVTNPGTHTLAGADMPAPTPGASLFVVGVVVGDAEFSQVGHPFMPSSLAPGSEASFTYVRPMVLTVSQLGPGGLNNPSFPFLPLALISRPEGTSTITPEMITDIRRSARPRSALTMNVASQTGTVFSSPSTTDSYVQFFSGNVHLFDVPTWATTGCVSGWLEGVRLEKVGAGNIAIRLSNGVTTAYAGHTQVRESAPGVTKERRSYNLGGVVNLVPFRGTSITAQIWTSTSNDAWRSFLSIDTDTSAMFQLHMTEAPS